MEGEKSRMEENRKEIAILGSTGHVGVAGLKLVRRFPDRFRVTALAAGSRVDPLFHQILEFRPRFVSLAGEEAAEALEKRLASEGVGNPPEIGVGESGSRAVVRAGKDGLLSAMSGLAGLHATLFALESGIRVALASKEPLVTAGRFLLEAAKKGGAELFPVDSEHAAIFQCLRAGRREDLERIYLTASGGPFFGKDGENTRNPGPREVLDHPVWRMGSKITVDSATLMNKGFEIIAAHVLFGLPEERIEVLIHPQAKNHSMVRFRDGAIVALLGETRMEPSIAHALAWPERLPLERPAFHAKDFCGWEFHRTPRGQYPCMDLAREALNRGGLHPAVLDGADEAAVSAFLNGGLPFGSIFPLIREVFERSTSLIAGTSEDSLEDALAVRARAKEEAVRRLGGVEPLRAAEGG